MTTIGALIGLMLSVFLIIKKIAPAYSLIAGAIVGGLLGGLPLVETVKMMTEGVKDVTPAIIRILTAGVLSGVLIKTGAAATLSNAIISSLGEKRVFGALALATMLLCAVGVFIDVAVITVAPVALSIGKRLGLSPSVLLVIAVRLNSTTIKIVCSTADFPRSSIFFSFPSPPNQKVMDLEVTPRRISTPFPSPFQDY